MIRIFTCILMCCASVGYAEVFHSEVVAEVRFSNFENELFLEVVLDKRMLSTALIVEADCQPEEMLSVCGSDYFENHLHLKVNSNPVSIQEPEMELFKSQVMYRYYLGDLGQPVEKLEVESDYLFDYHEHSILKVKVGIYDTWKSYNLTDQRRKIQAIIQ